MKKSSISVIWFVLVFIVTYFICSFCIPGWRIKLEADAMTVLIETLKIMMPIKVMISLVAGVIAGAIPFFIRNK